MVIKIFSDDDNLTRTNINLPKDEKEKIKESRALHITNLLRPFSLDQLKTLLSQTGTYDIENGFWINSVKSHCYVIYNTVEMARETFQALHNRQWPRNSEKRLNVEYVVEDSEKMQSLLRTFKSNQQQTTEKSKDQRRRQSLSPENQRLKRLRRFNESNDSKRP